LIFQIKIYIYICKVDKNQILYMENDNNINGPADDLINNSNNSSSAISITNVKRLVLSIKNY